MLRFVFIAIATTAASGWLAAAPVPPDVKVLVARLSEPSAKVRDEAAAALRGRPDALPWLRRAAKSADADTARRAAALLAPHEPKRQAETAKAIDAYIKSGQVGLFMEWHHFWQPESKDDLWPVGPRMARAGQDEFAKCFPPAGMRPSEPDPRFRLKPRSHDGPLAEMPRKGWTNTAVSIRTDRWWNSHQSEFLSFASVAGQACLSHSPGRYFVLGSVQADPPQMINFFVVCDGEFHNGYNGYSWRLSQDWGETGNCFVACRGNFRGGSVSGSVLLVDGDVELFEDGPCKVQDSLIRASGEIRIPKNVKVVNSTVVPHAKNATAPYKFFELSDVGLSVTDDEEGMVAAAVKADTPFGNSGLMKGDVILAIDDVPPGHSSEFRKKVRKATVVQGDCLLTVARGDKTLDLPVFFPLPR